MGSGYRSKPTGIAGLAARLNGLQREIDALRSSAGIKSAVLGDGDAITVRGSATVTTETESGPAARLSEGVVQVRPAPEDEWVPLADTVGPVDPVAPTSSPAPVADGFAGLVLLRWVAVLNDTPVTYEAHISTSDASPPSALTLVDEVQSTIYSARVDSDGDPLAYDTDYYVAIWAKSFEEYAPAPSAWVGPVRLDRTKSADIAADAIDGFTITGATVRTASAGLRTQLDSTGLRTFDSAGDETSSLVAEDGGMTLGGDLLVDGGISTTAFGYTSKFAAGLLAFGVSEAASDGDIGFHVVADSVVPSLVLRSSNNRVRFYGSNVSALVRLMSVADPTTAQDAATKAYVDNGDKARFAQVQAGTTQVITSSSSLVAVQLNSVANAIGTEADPSNNRIVISQAGLYLIKAYIAVQDASGASGTRQLTVETNGTGYESIRSGQSGGTQNIMSVTTISTLSVSDTVTMTYLQNSGSSRDVLTARLQVVRLGPVP